MRGVASEVKRRRENGLPVSLPNSFLYSYLVGFDRTFAFTQKFPHKSLKPKQLLLLFAPNRLFDFFFFLMFGERFYIICFFIVHWSPILSTKDIYDKGFEFTLAKL